MSQEPKNQKIPPALEFPPFKEPNTFAKFIIGKEEKTFTVHHETSCKVPVFKKAFESDFIEGQLQAYRLEDVSEQVFNFLMRFLYRENLPVMKLKERWKKWSNNDDNDYLVAVEEDRNLVDLWILGDRLCYSALQDCVIVTMKTVMDAELVFYPIIDYVHKSTTKDSILQWRGKILEALLDMTFYFAKKDDETEGMEDKDNKGSDDESDEDENTTLSDISSDDDAHEASSDDD
ncbi:hypothetical protein BDZ45DRAFT_692973 [Acephala macrosclerotiorum]|nr:hypothetical protein BDZ45DRAFT_692973 [Acephala macrosclerotiorum]